jgi:uncharacterized protein involved in outer membrane biogenesis
MPKLRKLLRSALLVLGVLALVVVALMVAAGIFADGMIQVAIENAGTGAVNAAVTIDKTRLSMLGRSLSIEGMTINNPPGYSHRPFLTLKRGDTRVKTLSLLSNKIAIRSLTLDGLDVMLESSGSGNNLQDVLNALHNATLSGKALYVSNLEITHITVNMMLPSSDGSLKAVPLKLSPIRMTDLGRNEQMDMRSLLHKILAAIATGIAEQGKQAAGPLGGVLDKALNLGRTLLGTGPEEHR